jgi:hypothetical protein
MADHVQMILELDSTPTPPPPFYEERIQQVQNQSILTAEQAKLALEKHNWEVEACLREVLGLPRKEKKIPSSTNQAIYTAIRQRMRITRNVNDMVVNIE